MAKDSHHAATYPPEDLYEDWKAEADEEGIPISRWIQYKVEAGRKKFDVTIEADEDVQELREEKADLRAQLRDAKERIEDLEDLAESREKRVVEDYAQDNPEAGFDEIVEHVRSTAPERVDNILTVSDEVNGRDP